MSGDDVQATRWVSRCEEIASLTREDMHTLPYGMVLSASSPVPLRLEGTGLVIWEMLETCRTQADLVEELSQTFGVSAEVIADDVDRFLSALETEGVVERTAEPVALRGVLAEGDRPQHMKEN